MGETRRFRMTDYHLPWRWYWRWIYPLRFIARYRDQQRAYDYLDQRINLLERIVLLGELKPRVDNPEL